MATAQVSARSSGEGVRRWTRGEIYLAAVGWPCLLITLVLVAIEPRGVANRAFLFWCAVQIVVELFPIRGWLDARFTLGQPIGLAVALIFTPHLAFVWGFVASFDPREVKREVGVNRALFNRGQLAITYWIGSVAFHSLARLDGPLPIVLAGGVVALAVSYSANVLQVALAATLFYGVRFREAALGLRLGKPIEFAVSYLSFGLLGSFLARLYLETGAEVAVIAFVLPLLLVARQLYLHVKALEADRALLQQRGEALKALSDRVAGERRDERTRIAADLHDEVIPAILSVNLLANGGELSMEQGKHSVVIESFKDIRGATNESLVLLRSVVSELRKSPIGPQGFQRALRQLADDLEASCSASISIACEDLALPEDQLEILFQIAREGLANASLHARASQINVESETDQESIRLLISDNGSGFDPMATPEGHFGLILMRERAEALGASLRIQSGPRSGTRVSVAVPRKRG